MHDVSSHVYITGFHINSIVFHISLQFNKYLSNFIYIGGGVCARELIREKRRTFNRGRDQTLSKLQDKIIIRYIRSFM